MPSWWLKIASFTNLGPKVSESVVATAFKPMDNELACAGGPKSSHQVSSLVLPRPPFY
jgi:hypothetical protein